MGLVDHCPRCGRTVRGENVSETALRQHLSECNDKEKIAKLQEEVNKKSIAEDKFNQEIEELSQETEHLVNEIEKWQT